MTMKSILIFFALVASLVAAPRLVPSDLPLRPTSTLELIFDEAMVPQATVGQKLENDLVTIEPAWEMDTSFGGPAILPDWSRRRLRGLARPISLP